MTLLALIVLALCPGVTSNSQLAKVCACAVCLLLETKNRGYFRLSPPGKMFLIWFAWAGFGCILSDHPALALNGWFLRVEGFWTYCLLVILAVSYWQNFQNIYWMMIPVLALCAVGPIFNMLTSDETMNWLFVPHVAQSCLFAMSAALLYSIDRGLVVLAIPALLYAGDRSGAWGALAGCGVHEWLSWKHREIPFKPFLAVAIVSGCLLTAFILPRSRLWEKIKHTSVDGTGSRAQYILQVAAMADHMPLTGCGLDTGIRYFTPTVGRTMDKASNDRAHNVIFDVLLWTGWIGLALWGLTAGACLGVTLKHPTAPNIACMSALSAWFAFSLLNPWGVPGLAFAIIAVFGIREETPEEIAKRQQNKTLWFGSAQTTTKT